VSNPDANQEASKPTSKRSTVASFLELGDGLAHTLVAALLLILAIGILVVSTYNFANQVLHLEARDSFSAIGLRYLSELLFGVIILELLSTILTYIRARNLEATIKDFLIVGLISSVRKILLVGATSSITQEKGNSNEFINEAIGTVITIVGILLLIGGLLLLDYRKKSIHSNLG
jgi:uncharacterized membrane protein (DUF373 family)